MGKAKDEKDDRVFNDVDGNPLPATSLKTALAQSESKKTIRQCVYSIMSKWQSIGSPSTTFEKMLDSDKDILFEDLGDDDNRSAKILKKTITLCGDGDFKNVIRSKMDTLNTTTKDRTFRDIYEVTEDRTKKRMLCRARFDGDPFFFPGDRVKVSVEILDDVPAIILRKVEDEPEVGDDK